MEGIELRLDDTPIVWSRLRQLKLGRAELLTDAIRLPFVDLQKELSEYALTSSEAQRKRLQARIKNYLARLNANPLLPLSFRLDVLDRLEKELDLFDGEITAAVLTGRLIALEMVLDACKRDRSLLELVPLLAAQSVELATRLHLLAWQRYEALFPLAVRQVHALVRLGMQAAAALEANAAAAGRLQQAAAMHELLRTVDFFALLPEEQRFVPEVAAQHALKAWLLSADAPTPKRKDVWLVGWLHQPHARPEVCEQLPKRPRPADALVVPLGSMVERLTVAVSKAEVALRGDRAHLATEQALRALAIGGRALLDGLAYRKRAHARRRSALRIGVESDAVKALERWIAERSDGLGAEGAEQGFGEPWLVVDRSRGGLRIERVSDELLLRPRMLVGFCARSGRCHLGFVRWVRRPKPTEVQAGIAAFAQRAEGFYWQAHPEAERLPCLIWRQGRKIGALLPETHLLTRTTFRLFASQADEEGEPWRIEEVIEQGVNYTLATVALVQMD